MINLKTKKAVVVAANSIICLCLLLFFANYFFDFIVELTGVIIVIVLLTTIILVVRFKQLLLYLLSFIIPLSVPFSIGSSELSFPAELIVVLLSGFFFIKLISGVKLDSRFLSHPVTLLILLDLAWILFSSIFSQLPEVSIKRFIIRLCYYITFYYFYFELFNRDKKNIRKVLVFHALGFLIPIIYSTVKHSLIGFATVGSQRISAPFYYDHTIYGACLALFIPFLTCCLFDVSKKKEKIFFGSMLLIFIAAVILSYSRAAWISLFVASVFALILHYRVKFRYLAIAGMCLIVAALLNIGNINKSLNESKEISHSNNVGMHLKSISNINTDASNKERINRWKCALRMFADKPLLGFGPGTYQFFYGEYQQREDMTYLSTFSGLAGHAHSEYLNYLSETGLPGLLIFVSLLIAVSVTAVKTYKTYTEPNGKRTILYLLTGLITFFLHAFFNGFLEFDKMAMPVFASMAAVVSLNFNQPTDSDTPQNNTPA